MPIPDQEQKYLELFKIFKTIGFSYDIFDFKHNMKWGLDHEKTQKRGPPDWKYDYYFPLGWKGYALNVLSKYENNAKWI